MRAVIVANGPLVRPPFGRFGMGEDDLVICVDGGANNAIALGLKPDVVIGDMDSLGAELREHLEQEGCRFIEYPSRKDETDSELAVRHALSQGAKEFILLAALGGRIDHTLANVMLLALPELEAMDARLIDGQQEVLLVRDKVLIEGEPGDTVSLIPLSGDVVGIDTEGLEYGLQNGTLEFGAARGVSNVLMAAQASVRVERGLLLLVHHHRDLPSSETGVDLQGGSDE